MNNSNNINLSKSTEVIDSSQGNSVNGLIKAVLYSMGLFLFALFQSCATNLHLGPDDYLIKNEPKYYAVERVVPDTTGKRAGDSLKITGKPTIEYDDLYSGIKSHQNKRMLFAPKTFLHLNSFGKTILERPRDTVFIAERILGWFVDAEFWIDSVASFLINTAGEEPLLIDSMQLQADAENLQNVYFTKGFFNAKVNYRVEECRSGIHAHKSRVTFLIEEGSRAIIADYSLKISDQRMEDIIMAKWDERLLKVNDPYDEDKIVAERARIAALMRNWGYYKFSPALISFNIDTRPPLDSLPSSVSAEDTASGKSTPIKIELDIQERTGVYRVGRVTMIIDPAEFDPMRDSELKVIHQQTMNDSLREKWGLTQRLYSDSNRITFMTYERVLNDLNLNFMEKQILLEVDQRYSQDIERQTITRLQNLGIFKYVLVKHVINEIDRTIDVQIQAVLLPKYYFKAGLEGFFEASNVVTQNYPGFGGQVGFGDKLLFQGAERLDLSGNLRVSFFKLDRDKADYTFFYEGGGTASLIFPHLLLPAITTKNLQGRLPSTSFSFTYNRQQNSLYTKNVYTSLWSYKFYHSDKKRTTQSIITPFSANLVITSLEQQLLDKIDDISNQQLLALLARDFRPRFISSTRYDLTHSNYMSTRVHPTISFKASGEIGGNLPFAIDRLFRVGEDSTWEEAKIANIFYGQFWKLTFEHKYFFPLTHKSDVLDLVVRNYIGFARPWNFTPYVPYEVRFYSGGTNSMRGWLSGTLGPGTSIPDSSLSSQELNFETFFNPGGEVIFETNLELRWHVNNMIELAFFTDIGNVWVLPGSTYDVEGSKLTKDTWNQLGWDVGTGLRLDFDFFIFRMDIAQKLYAPDIQDYVIKSWPNDLLRNGIQVNFGIGYPF